MAKVIEIGVSSEGKAYRDGIENDVIKPTEDAEKQLKEFGKAGDKAGDEIEKAMRGAQKESDRTRVDIEKMGSEIEKAARESRAFGGDARKGMGDAGDAVQEFGNEARQNLSETVSSFRGDVEDVAQIAQDILGGVVGGLGPIGMAAGAAGAAGIGLMVASLQKAAEKAEELREQANELALEIVDAGGNIEDVAMVDRLNEWALAVRDNKEWWEVWQESTITNLDAVDTALGYTSRSGQQLFDAMSGQDPKAAIAILEEYEARINDLSEAYEDVSSHSKDAYGRKEELLAEKNALQDVTEAIRERQGFEEVSIETAQKLIKYNDERRASEEAVAASMQLRDEAISALQGELDEAVNSWGDYHDAETGATDPAAYITAMQARMDATSSFSTNVQELAHNTGLSFEEAQTILDQGVDFAPMLAAIMAGGPEMQAQYAGQIQTMLDGGQSIIDGTETTATITTKTDSEVAEQQLDAAATERQAPVKATADTKAADTQLDAIATKQRTARISASADTSAAARAIDRLVEDRTITIHARVLDQRGVPVP